MRKDLTLLAMLILALSCNQQQERSPDDEPILGMEPQDTVDTERPDVEELAKTLKDQGHQIFLYKEGDTTYLMQQYYLVLLKSGENRKQDSLETARLMQGHLAHLTRMAEEGYSSLTGPFGGDGEIRGAVIYNTPTLAEADSLANLDPMVKAGRLKVEVHPWWIAKGGKLP